MTPEHTFALWITVLTGLPTIVFTGAVAYWTWRRDQERIIVQKVPQHWETLDGTENDATLCGVGINVINLSLYPVRIAGLAFLDGKKQFPLDRDKHEEQWPQEIVSHSRMVVYATEGEWELLADALGNRGRVMDWKVVAVVVTETGGRFASNGLSVRIARRLRTLRRWLKR
jgi:hypothetical protein